jgi:hypothetical protein
MPVRPLTLALQQRDDVFSLFTGWAKLIEQNDCRHRENRHRNGRSQASHSALPE